MNNTKQYNALRAKAILKTFQELDPDSLSDDAIQRMLLIGITECLYMLLGITVSLESNK